MVYIVHQLNRKAPSKVFFRFGLLTWTQENEFALCGMRRLLQANRVYFSAFNELFGEKQAYSLRCSKR